MILKGEYFKGLLEFAGEYREKAADIGEFHRRDGRDYPEQGIFVAAGAAVG